MLDDRELLQEYVGHHSERAFAELVARHLPFALATALRVVPERQTAEDVVQTVFIQLARKAWTIREGQLLSGWIYRVTHHTALNAVRQEHRRRQRETDAMKLSETPSGAEPAWEHLAPLIDEAMQQLKRQEQDALLLRFFEDKSYGEVGRILRVDEKTAGQRVNRALEKMRVHFSRRGVTTTAALLASSLTSHAATPVSAGLAAKVAGASLAGAGGGLLSGSFLKTYFMIISTKNVLVTVGVLALAITSFQLGQHTAPAVKSPPVAKKSAAPANLSIGKSNAKPKNIPWDLQGPLAEILRKYKGGARLVALTKLVEQTPVSQLGALLDSASSCPIPGIAIQAKELVYAKWVAADPQGALAYANIASTKKGDSSDYDAVFSSWAGIDPKAALDAAATLGLAPFRAFEITQVLATWAQDGNPMSALAAMKTLPPGMATANMTELVFGAWSEQDPRAALGALDQIGNVGTRNAVENLIIRNFAASDPQAAFDALRTMPIGNQNPNTYSTIFQKWGLEDPVAADAALQNLPAGTARTNAIKSVFDSWAQTDPSAALQAAQAFPPGSECNTAISLSLRGLDEQDPTAAGDYLAQMPAGSNRDNLISTLANLWANTDPTAALAWLGQNSTGHAYDLAAGKVLDQMSKSDPISALNFITQIAAGTNQDKYLQTAIGNWASLDPAAAMAWVNTNLNGTSQTTALSTVANQLASSDPTAAINLINNLPDSPARNTAVDNLATQLAATDVNAAVQWLQNLPDGVSVGTRQTAYQNVINSWAAVDPASAAAYAATLAGDPNLSTVVSQVAKLWSQSDGSAALIWAESLPLGAAQDSAVSASVNNWASTDPQAAWQYAQNLPASASASKLLLSVATTWSQSDPAAAADAVVSLPGNVLSNGSAIMKVVSNYEAYDDVAAKQWVSSLPAGQPRDLALSGIVTYQTIHHPGSALQWAAKIDDNVVRASTIGTVVGYVAKTDPVAAARDLQAAPLSEAQKQVIASRYGL